MLRIKTSNMRGELASIIPALQKYSGPGLPLEQGLKAQGSKQYLKRSAKAIIIILSLMEIVFMYWNQLQIKELQNSLPFVKLLALISKIILKSVPGKIVSL
jgi:hypothetical protein